MLNRERLQFFCEKYGINTVYLFGSFADGSHFRDSDLDLAYLCANRCINIDYGQLHFDLQECSDRRIDLIDLRTAPLVLAFAIIKDGEIIYDLNEEIRTDFEDNIIRKYLDFSTFHRLTQKEIDGNFGLEGSYQ